MPPPPGAHPTLLVLTERSGNEGGNGAEAAGLLGSKDAEGNTEDAGSIDPPPTWITGNNKLDKGLFPSGKIYCSLRNALEIGNSKHEIHMIVIYMSGAKCSSRIFSMAGMHLPTIDTKSCMRIEKEWNKF